MVRTLVRSTRSLIVTVGGWGDHDLDDELVRPESSLVYVYVVEQKNKSIDSLKYELVLWKRFV